MGKIRDEDKVTPDVREWSRFIASDPKIDLDWYCKPCEVKLTVYSQTVSFVGMLARFGSCEDCGREFEELQTDATLKRLVIAVKKPDQRQFKLVNVTDGPTTYTMLQEVKP